MVPLRRQAGVPSVCGLGSTTQLADGAGTVSGDYAYEAFGSVRSHTGATTEWSFSGEQNDPTGLEYLRARYHEPALGRLQLSVAREKGDAKESTISWGTALAEPVSELTKCSASLSRAADSPSAPAQAHSGVHADTLVTRALFSCTPSIYGRLIVAILLPYWATKAVM